MNRNWQATIYSAIPGGVGMSAILNCHDVGAVLFGLALVLGAIVVAACLMEGK